MSLESFSGKIKSMLMQSVKTVKLFVIWHKSSFTCWFLFSKEIGPNPAQSPILPDGSHVRPVDRSAVPGQPVAHSSQHPLPLRLQLPTGIRHHRLSRSGPDGNNPVSVISSLIGWHSHQTQTDPQAAPSEAQLASSSAPHHAWHQSSASGAFIRSPGWFVSWGKHVHR